jgi:uncharacterized membrane protein YfcA
MRAGGEEQGRGVEAGVLIGAGLGLGIGFVMAMTGAGGGVLAVPLLGFAYGMRVQDAAPVALLAVCLAACIGSAMGLHQGKVRYRAAAWIAATAMLGAPCGFWLGRHLPNGPLLLLFAAVLAWQGVRLLRSTARPGGGAHATSRPHAPTCAIDPLTHRLHWTPVCAAALGATGLVAGFLSTLLGIGGGFVVVPALMHVTDLEMESVTATSLAVIALIAAGSAAVMLAGGAPVSWRLALPFALGTATGLAAGRCVAPRMPHRRLVQVFAVCCVTVAAVLFVNAWEN